ncbi:MAG: hypothetical protein U1D55_04530 [Phycisphaerae bacterium]
MNSLGRLAYLALTLLIGCAAPRQAVLRDDPLDYESPPAPNLVLGGGPRLLRIADDLTERSNWPSVPIGYRFNEESYSTHISYDDQSYYDRFGGGFNYVTQSVRTGVLVR